MTAWLNRQLVVPGALCDPSGGAGRDRTDAVDLVRLRQVMALTSGRPDVVLGLVDGPVTLDHPTSLPETSARSPEPRAPAGTLTARPAHGTFVAGILAARRGPHDRRYDHSRDSLDRNAAYTVAAYLT